MSRVVTISPCRTSYPSQYPQGSGWGLTQFWRTSRSVIGTARRPVSPLLKKETNGKTPLCLRPQLPVESPRSSTRGSDLRTGYRGTKRDGGRGRRERDLGQRPPWVSKSRSHRRRAWMDRERADKGGPTYGGVEPKGSILRNPSLRLSGRVEK